MTAPGASEGAAFEEGSEEEGTEEEEMGASPTKETELPRRPPLTPPGRPTAGACGTNASEADTNEDGTAASAATGAVAADSSLLGLLRLRLRLFSASSS